MQWLNTSYSAPLSKLSPTLLALMGPKMFRSQVFRQKSFIMFETTVNPLKGILLIEAFWPCSLLCDTGVRSAATQGQFILIAYD